MLSSLKYWMVIAFTISGLNGCSKPQNFSTEYSRSQINSIQKTIIATILSKRVVTVDGDAGVGGAAGGLMVSLDIITETLTTDGINSSAKSAKSGCSIDETIEIFITNR